MANITLKDINATISSTGVVLSDSVLNNATVIVNNGASATLTDNKEFYSLF